MQKSTESKFTISISSNKIITQYSLTKINQLICFLIKQFVKSQLYEHKRTVSSALVLNHRQSLAKLYQQLLQFVFPKCLEKISKHRLFAHLPYKICKMDFEDPSYTAPSGLILPGLGILDRHTSLADRCLPGLPEGNPLRTPLNKLGNQDSPSPYG